VATGKIELSDPTATNNPELLTVTDLILDAVVLPFIAAGVVQVLPSVDVAYAGQPVLGI
jgi:hypothetical protein